MTIYEMIVAKKGYLKSSSRIINLKDEDFEKIMKWNPEIAKGTIKEKLAYRPDGSLLRGWEWVSLEKPVKTEVKEEKAD